MAPDEFAVTATAVDEAPLRLERFLPYRLSVLANTVSRSIAREYAARFNLTIAEWRVMAVLGRFAPLSARDVVARTAMDKVRVSRAVAGLLRTKLIVRRVDPGDRRRALLRLSPKGEGIYRRIAPLALAREAELVAALSECERGQLDRLLAKLQARADSVSDGLAAEAPD